VLELLAKAVRDSEFTIGKEFALLSVKDRYWWQIGNVTARLRQCYNCQTSRQVPVQPFKRQKKYLIYLQKDLKWENKQTGPGPLGHMS
jgi:hypothetical protein